MVHAFSLVHDDLPALDDDAVRRGRATVHAAYGEAMAVLVGDGLLALAFRLLSERVGDAALAGRLVAELSAGTSRMVNGQVLDTFGGAVVGGVEGLRGIHRAKTGALIRVSCRMGGLCAGVGAGAPGLAALTGYGEDVGLMFQVVDDLLDVEGEAEAVGKATGKDAAAGKLTYPGVLGVAGSRAEVERLRASALGRLSALEAGGGDRVGGLVRMCEELAKRTA
jgi:geranylgeranyl pyrophosphate synthase